MKTLDWVKSNINGGVTSMIVNGKAGGKYPEVTGYLIPTLLAYGEKNLAQSMVKWLVSIQNEDGSYNGLHGKPAIFDTCAVIEGLEAAGEKTASAKAREWVTKTGIKPTDAQTGNYLLRCNAIMGIKPKHEIAFTGRLHYIAYGLEGLYRMGVDITKHLSRLPQRADLLMPYDYSGSGTDLCASAQIAWLRRETGLQYRHMVLAIEKWVRQDGGIPQCAGEDVIISWAAKYYLDAVRP